VCIRIFRGSQVIVKVDVIQRALLACKAYKAAVQHLTVFRYEDVDCRIRSRSVLRQEFGLHGSPAHCVFSSTKQ
jgi:hypothetical protein